MSWGRLEDHLSLSVSMCHPNRFNPCIPSKLGVWVQREVPNHDRGAGKSKVKAGSCSLFAEAAPSRLPAQ